MMWGRVPLLLLGVLVLLLLGAGPAPAADYMVNTTGDQVDEAPGSEGCKTSLGNCTLRAAIEESNASVGMVDTIEFAEAFDGDVADTINLGTSLPTITDRANIEGYPRPMECETDYFSTPGPCVGIDGPAGGTTFRVAAERVLLIGFAVSNAKTAVEAVGAPGLEVWTNWFGLKLDGSAGPLETALFVDQNSNGASIGLSTNANNIFAHSTNAGVEINGADYANLNGNGFGVLPDGISLAANATNIEIADAASGQNRVARGNWIGGAYRWEDPASTICDVWCNVISGATEAGIDLSGQGPGQDPASGSTRIIGNYIGLNAFGTSGLPNAQQAIRVGAAENVTIGGPRGLEGNLINGGHVGVLAQPHANNLEVTNNWIGLDATGSKMLAPPSTTGIEVEGGYQVEVVGNRISMAGGTAIEQVDNSMVIRGNQVGRGVAGQELPGADVGLRMEGCRELCSLVEGNVYANAAEHGLLIEGENNKIFGNRIEAAGGAGILIRSKSGFEGYRNSIGADSAAEENTISGNGAAAIEIRDEGPFGETFRNVVGRNNGAANGAPFLLLVGGAHRGILPPTIATATQEGTQGQGAEPGATVRVFRKATTSPGEIESFLAETVADENGDWAVAYPSPIAGGTIVAASQTEEVKGTSEFAFAATGAPPGPSPSPDEPGEQPKATSPVPIPDTAAPETSIIRGPKSRSRSRVARFEFIATESSSFLCKLDRAVVRSCRSPRVYRRLKVGRHVFKVWAIDIAGNKDSTPARFVFRITSPQ
jgi:CSLREA domain-containing protein